MDSDVLAEAVANPVIDPRAEEMCIERGTGSGLLAALDSTSSEVRAIGTEVETRGRWDDGLPQSPDAYVAICIYDLSGLEHPFREGSRYMAQWATIQPLFSGNGILTIW